MCLQGNTERKRPDRLGIYRETMLDWIYGTSSISVSGNMGYSTVGAEEMSILIIWVLWRVRMLGVKKEEETYGDPLPTTTTNVFDDG